MRLSFPLWSSFREKTLTNRVIKCKIIEKQEGGIDIKAFFDSCVEWLSSEYVVALCSFLGIISFFTSAYAAIETSKIDRILNKYKHQMLFQEEQNTILEKLDGFIDVAKSGNLTKSFIPDIVCQVRSISSNHKSILTIKARLKLFFLLSYLKKPYDRINSYDLAIKIGDLKGFLEKKEV